MCDWTPFWHQKPHDASVAKALAGPSTDIDPNAAPLLHTGVIDLNHASIFMPTLFQGPNLAIDSPGWSEFIDCFQGRFPLRKAFGLL